MNVKTLNQKNKIMNEELDLVKILKDCPKGAKLYSPICGEVYFCKINDNDSVYPILVNIPNGFSCSMFSFTKEGRLKKRFNNGECMLFPSNEQRDWSEFKPNTKYDPKTLQSFDKVLIFNHVTSRWNCDFYSYKSEKKDERFPFVCIGDFADIIIPYNEETKHLVGTDEEAPEFYRYWEEEPLNKDTTVQ